VYYDAYRRRRYEAVRSKDLKSWESITDNLELPCRFRHGTVFAVPPVILKGLLAAR